MTITLSSITKSFFLAVGTMLLSSAITAENMTMRIGTASYPPSINRQLEAPSAMIQNSIQSMSEDNIDTIYIHYGERWDLVYKDLIEGKIDASLWWADTAERRKLFHYPKQPLITFPNSIAGLKSNPRIANIPNNPTPRQIKDLKIGQIKNFYIPSNIDASQVIFVENSEELAKGLSNGQFDLVIRKANHMQKIFDELGIQSELKKIEIERTKGYLMLSKAISADKVKAIIDANDKNLKTIHSSE